MALQGLCSWKLTTMVKILCVHVSPAMSSEQKTQYREEADSRFPINGFTYPSVLFRK